MLNNARDPFSSTRSLKKKKKTIDEEQRRDIKKHTAIENKKERKLYQGKDQKSK